MIEITNSVIKMFTFSMKNCWFYLKKYSKKFANFFCYRQILES